MSHIEQQVASQKQKHIRQSLLLLARNSTRENQRLDAMRCAWTAQLTSLAIDSHWGSFINTECGAIVELGHIRIPFSNVVNKKKKAIRRAIYIIARIGHQVQDSELYTFGREVTELVISNKLTFKNVDPKFELQVELFGMELPEKEKLKAINPDAKFTLWAKIVLTNLDMINSTQSKPIQISPNAPKVHPLYGKIDLKLSGAIPTFCDVLKEGFLHLWTEGDAHLWQFIYVKLQKGHLYGFDPSIGKHKKLISVEITGELKISESSKRRKNSFQLRDFNGRTILAASSKVDMDDWMQLLRKHKRDLKSWGRIQTYNEPETDSIDNSPYVADVEKPWSAFFMKDTKVTIIKSRKKITTNRRRSKSIDNSPYVQPNEGTDGFDRNCNTGRRRRSNSRDTPVRIEPIRREWMTSQNRVVPFISPVPTIDPPTIVITSSGDEGESSTLDAFDDSISAILDQADITEQPQHSTRYSRRDTEFMHSAIKAQTAKLAEQKISRQPLRTSTQINEKSPCIKSKHQYVPQIRQAPVVKRVQFGSKPQQGEVTSSGAVQFHDSINVENECKVVQWIDNNQKYQPSTPSTMSYNEPPSVQVIGVGIIEDSTLDDATTLLASRNAISEASKRAFKMPRFRHLEK